MIKRIEVSNFRSLKKVGIDLAPITFIYGNNAAGKSSIFYALNVIRNIVLNSNQPTDAFFNLGFFNLGSYKSVVFDHDENNEITIAVKGKISKVDYSYQLTFKNNTGAFFFDVEKPFSFKLKLPITFPYPVNLNVQQVIEFENEKFNLNWTGVALQVTPEVPTADNAAKADQLTQQLNKMIDTIRKVDVVPLKRGFTKTNFGAGPQVAFPITEDEVATMLANDHYIDGRVSAYLEEIADRQFKVRNVAGSPVAFLQTTEKGAKQPIDLVNDGFGINQLVYVLAKVLNNNATVVCIEEPEINLHPSIIVKLPKILHELAASEKKQIIVSTHSDLLLRAALGEIAQKRMSTREIVCYKTEKQKGLTLFTKQVPTKDGQISGGLTNLVANPIDMSPAEGEEIHEHPEDIEIGE